MIYFVATIEDLEKMNTRTVGYFKTLEKAAEAILNNRYDIHEDIYKYAVIEAVEEGIYKSAFAESFWFEWQDDHYVDIGKPKELENYAGFTIG